MSPVDPIGERLAVQLIDDSEDDLLLTREAIKIAGTLDVVHIARTGLEAMAYLRGRTPARVRPDLILLDVNLPIMDGFETLDAIRRDPELRHFPVVIFSGSDREEDVLRAYRGGAVSFLRKSKSFDDLCTAMTRLAAYWREVVCLPEKPTTPGRVLPSLVGQDLGPRAGSPG